MEELREIKCESTDLAEVLNEYLLDSRSSGRSCLIRYLESNYNYVFITTKQKHWIWTSRRRQGEGNFHREWLLLVVKNCSINDKLLSKKDTKVSKLNLYYGITRAAQRKKYMIKFWYLQEKCLVVFINGWIIIGFI